MTLWPLRSWIWQTLYILYSFEVGIFLVFLPWLNIWENNYLLFRYPHFRGVVANSFVRGAVLGLGIVNVLIAIQEITRLKKSAKEYLSR